MGPSDKDLEVRLVNMTDKLNLSSNYSNADWVERQVSKGRLTRALADTIPKLMEAGEIAFPGRWDIQFGYRLDIKQQWHHNTYGYGGFDTDRFHHVLTTNNLTEQQLYSISNDYILYECYKSPAGEKFKTVFETKIVMTTARIVIHFPEVTITNKYRQSHDIKDLFIALQFDSRGQVLNDLQGTRSTYSELEVVGSYVHSHLRSVDFKKEKGSVLTYASFCKGTGSILSCLSFYNADKSLPNLLSILYHLNTTANHESIDGGPHYRMESLMGKEGLSTAPSDSNRQEAWSDISFNIYQTGLTVGTNYIPLALDWTYNAATNKYSIVDNDKLNTFCVEYAKGTDSKKWLVLKADNGMFYKQTTSLNFRRSDYPQYTKFIPFRGQRFQFAVYAKPGPVISDKKVYIHPLIKEYVKSKLESFAAKAAFKSSAIEYLDQVGNH